MKHKYVFILVLLLFLVGCNNKINEEDLLNEFLENYTINLMDEEFDFPNEVTYKNNNILLEWIFSNEILDENNEVIHYDAPLRVIVSLKATLNYYSKNIEVGEFTSQSKNEVEKEFLNNFLEQYVFNQTNDYKVDLPEQIKYENKTIVLTWKIDDGVLDKNNYIIHKENEYEARVILKATKDNVSLEKEVGTINSLSLEEMKEKYFDYDKNIVDKFKASFYFNQTSDEKIELVDNFIIEDNIVNLSYIYDDELIKKDGKIIHGTDTLETEIFVIASFGCYSETISLGKILVKSAKSLLNEVLDSFYLPEETSDDIDLLKNINGVDVFWSSDNEEVLSDEGKYKFVNEDTEVILNALFCCEDEEIEKDYKILVKPYDNYKRLNLVMDSIDISSVVLDNLDLKEEYLYGVKAIWESSKKDVISNSGKVTLGSESTDVVLKLKLYIGEESMEKEFSVKTIATKKVDLHYLVEKTNDFEKNNMFNLEVKGDRVSLIDGEIYGYYDSAIYETLNFEELVGSWAAITSTSATCELLIKIRVNGTWSKYFTYGIWGLGRNNLYYNQKDENAKMSVDEILPINGLGDAFQYRIILRRDSKDTESPKLGLVAITIRIPDYEYKVDVSGLDSFVDYDVAKVNQNVVPTIGNSICSATTSTMLLKYKGFDFSEYDEYENRYIANLVADRGHNSPTYGNWVYNTVTMGAYGLSSYVKHMYSWDELKLHLATVGPVGASISGNTGLYTTGGHLIVVRGYREVEGKTYVICNDPNINERFKDSEGNPLFVYYEFPLETFMNFWRGTIYVVE